MSDPSSFDFNTAKPKPKIKQESFLGLERNLPPFDWGTAKPVDRTPKTTAQATLNQFSETARLIADRNDQIIKERTWLEQQKVKAKREADPMMGVVGGNERIQDAIMTDPALEAEALKPKTQEQIDAEYDRSPLADGDLTGKEVLTPETFTDRVMNGTFDLPVFGRTTVPGVNAIKQFNDGVGILTKGALDIPFHAAATTMAGFMGLHTTQDRTLIDNLIDRSYEIADKFRDENGKMQFHGIPGLIFQDAAGMPQNLGFMASTMLANLFASVPVALVTKNPKMAWAAGSAASGFIAYNAAARSAFDDLRRTAEETSLEANGRPLTEAEFKKLHDEYDWMCRKIGIYEAAIEAGTSYLDWGITKNLTKLERKAFLEAEVKKAAEGSERKLSIMEELTGINAELNGAKAEIKQSLLGKIKKSVGPLIGEMTGTTVIETSSEAWTDYMQTGEQYIKDLVPQAPNIIDSYNKVFSATLLTGMSAGLGFHTMNKMVDKVILTKPTPKDPDAAPVSKDMQDAMNDLGASAAALDAKKLLVGETPVQPVEALSSNPEMTGGVKDPAQGPAIQTQTPVAPVAPKTSGLYRASEPPPPAPGEPGAPATPKLEKKGPPKMETPRFSEPKDVGLSDIELLNAHGQKVLQDKRDKETLVDVITRTIAVEEEHNELDLKLLNKEADDQEVEAIKELDAAYQDLQKKMEAATAPGEETTAEAVKEADKAQNVYEAALKKSMEAMGKKASPNALKVLKGIDARKKRIEGLNRQLEKTIDEVDGLDSRLIELMEIERLKGVKEAAASLESTDEVMTTVSKLDKVVERSWNAQLDKFMIGLNEGSRIALKYAKGAQRYLVDVVRMSKSLTGAQKARMLQTIIKVQTPEQFAEQEPVLRSMIKEMRTANVVNKIRDEIEKIADRNPDIALKGKNKDKKTVDRVFQPLVKTIRGAFARTKESARTRLAVLRGLPDLGDTVAERMKAWEIKALEIIIEPELYAASDFYNQVIDLEKTGRAYLDKKREAKIQQVNDDITEMVDSINANTKADAIPRFATNEDEDQEAAARSTWEKTKDLIKKADAPLMAARALCKKLDGFNPIGACTRLIAGKITRMVNTQSKMLADVHTILEEIYEPINEICRRSTTGTKYVKEALLPYVRANYLNAKDKTYTVQLEAREIIEQRKAAKKAVSLRYNEAIKQAKDAGQILNTEARKQILDQIQEEEKAAMEKRLEKILAVPKGKENDPAAKTRAMGLEVKQWKFNRRERMGLYALSKNAHQKQMVTDMMYGNGIPETVFEEVVADVTPEERAIIDAIRERVLEPLFQKASDVNYRLFNFRPKSEEFYWPLHVLEGYKPSNADDIMMFMRGYSEGMRGEIGLGAMLERIERGAAPVDYDFYGTLMRHVNDTVHFISHAEDLSALNRYISSTEFKRAATKVITLDEYRHAFVDKLVEMSNPRTSPLDFWTSKLKWARETMTSMVIGFKYSTGIQNVSTLLAVARREGWNVPRVVKTMLMVASSKTLRSRIKGMSERVASRNRDRTTFLSGQSILDEMQNGLSGKTISTLHMGLAAATSEVQALGHMFIAMMDDWMAMTAWYSAHEYALNSGDADMVQNAELFADGVLMDTQASYSQADLPTFLKNNEYMKLVSSLYIFMNSQFQGTITDLSQAHAEWGDHRRLKAMSTILGTMIARVIGPAMITMVLVKPGDLDEPEEYLHEIIGYALGMAPVIRDYSDTISKMITGDKIPFQNGGSSLAYNLINKVATIAGHNLDFWHDETGEKPFLSQKDVVDLLGIAFRLPSAQLNLSLDAWRDNEENARNEGAFWFGASLLTGYKHVYDDEE